MVAVKKHSMIAIWISLLSNVVLTVLKVTVGLLFQSHVLIADGVHNAGDVIATLAAFGAMRISNQPADEDHPYGHGKAEVIGAGIVSVVLAIVAVMIAYQSIMDLLNGASPAHIIPLIAAIISLFAKQTLYVYTIRIGKRMKSKSLTATAYDHLADVYASAAAAIGIGLALIGNHYEIAILSYGDPIASIIVSALVLKLAISIGRETIDILMEKNVPRNQIEQYADLILTVPQVKRIDRLRAREHGHYILVDVRVSIPGQLSIVEGHNIGRQIKETILHTHDDVGEVLVHLNPWYPDDV